MLSWLGSSPWIVAMSPIMPPPIIPPDRSGIIGISRPPPVSAAPLSAFCAEHALAKASAAAKDAAKDQAIILLFGRIPWFAAAARPGWQRLQTTGPMPDGQRPVHATATT